MPTRLARRSVFLIVAALVMTTPVSGCGRSAHAPRRRPLVGAVVVDGTPAFSGAVSLYPRAGHAGPVATAEIRAGTYAFTVSNGPTAGPHRAVVVFLRDTAEATAFQPRYGKARPPQPGPPPTAEGAKDPTAATPTEPEAADTPAVDSGAPPPPSPAPPPANMREFDVEVPATDPPRLDFTIDRGASP